MQRRHQILLLVFLTLTFFAIIGVYTVLSLQSKVSQRLEKGWVIPPLELYSQGLLLAPGRKISFDTINSEMEKRGWQSQRDFVIDSGESCKQRYGLEIPENATHCLWLKNPSLVVTWDDADWIVNLFKGAPLQSVASYSLFPKLISEFFEGQPILQQNTPLSEMPLACLQAVTAIEDKEFLEHKGVSATGILRAMVRNLRAGSFKEGGSTITQQLVKNFFLSPKKTLRRKIEEQLLAVLLEAQIGKDQILEMYLNVIYMGQNGPFQVRGMGSAAQYYFDRNLSQLGLPECALLAAVINSPGRYSPFDHPQSALTRRELVLEKMREAGMISQTEFNEARSFPLPTVSPSQKRTQAPFFISQALREFQEQGLETEEGARLYTSLDPDVQAATNVALAQTLPLVEGRIKTPAKVPLQSAVIVVDLPSAQILALSGGRDFKISQYNRAIDSRRQIGSVIKPFVYLPAMRDKDPLTPVLDEPFEWKVGKQVWKPKNYENKNFGLVPYFFALANSLNAPAAKVGQEVGLDNILLALNQAGVELDIPLLPSITLGAVEMSPLEVAQAFTTIGRFGMLDHVHALERVEDPRGTVLFEREASEDIALDPVATGVLVGMMRTTLEIGSAKAARALGLEGEYAGKTGTTSDTKDAWFVGFNNRLLTVVWVGYDDNTAMGLTGAGAALPIWTDLNKQLQSVFLPGKFAWPSGVEPRTVPREELLKTFPNLKNLPEQIELMFGSWAS